eukprot:3761344-Rhodomonas_salina.1
MSIRGILASFPTVARVSTDVSFWLSFSPSFFFFCVEHDFSVHWLRAHRNSQSSARTESDSTLHEAGLRASDRQHLTWRWLQGQS